MNKVCLGFGKFLIFILLAFSTFAFASGTIDKQEQKNAEAKAYLEQKQKMYSTSKSEVKEYTFFEKITISILGVVFFFIIPFFVPFMLLFLAFKNNKEFKEIFFWFSLFKAIAKR